MDYLPQIYRIITPVLVLLFLVVIVYIGRRIKKK